MSDKLNIGDLVIINDQFKSHMFHAARYEGIGVIIKIKEVYGGELYEIYFNNYSVKRIPRHWIIKIGGDNTISYCPIEEEWKVWGDI